MNKLRLFIKWAKMLRGNSIFHVIQGKGKIYSKQKIMGYYNDLTCKVSPDTLLDDHGIPYNITAANVTAYFPITIFQYGLGLYDLYLLEHDRNKLTHCLKIADWSIARQRSDGSWDCMGALQNKVAKTQSSMCQSEGASLLLRAYMSTKNIKYYKAAEKAIKCMLLPIEDGGTTLYCRDDVVFEEYVTSTNLAVLNGWIFSIFGLYDLTLLNENKKYKKLLNDSLSTLIKYLPKYDRQFWSDYDICGTIASPFYHNLHVDLLSVLYDLFGNREFKIYADKWLNYSKSKSKKWRSMLIKLKQKLWKNRLYDNGTGLVK